VSRRLHFDPSTLSASISLMTPRDQWESHVFSSPDSQSIETSSVMSSNYEYDFFISLSLYDNEVNRDVPFSCRLELSDVDDRVLARSVRSILLSHRSVLVRYYEDISSFFKYLIFLHNGRDVEVSLGVTFLSSGSVKSISEKEKHTHTHTNTGPRGHDDGFVLSSRTLGVTT